jgi:hypothetical protein
VNDPAFKEHIKSSRERTTNLVEDTGNGAVKMAKIRQERLQKQKELNSNIEFELEQYKKDLKFINQA